MNTVATVFTVWGSGLLLAAATLWLYGRAKSDAEQVLSVVGLVVWVLASTVLAGLLVAWWLPSS